ncbi:MAG: hypothetical protein ABH851_05545 [Methanobacteriota archaeon]
MILSRTHISALIGFLFLSLVLNLNLIESLSTHVPGSFDVWSMLWMIWWWKTSILDYHRLPYFVDVLGHPWGVDYSGGLTNHFTNFLSIPIYFVTDNLALTYNTFYLFSIMFSGFAAYLLVNYLTKSPKAAFISGFAYTFSPYHIGLGAHGLINLMHIGWIPLCLMFLLKTLKEGGYKNPFYAAVFFALNGFCDFTYMFYFALVILLFVFYFRFSGGLGENGFKKILFFACVSAVLLLPVLIKPILWFLSGPSQTPIPWHGVYSADLASLFIPSMHHPIFNGIFEEAYQVIGKPVPSTIVYIGWSIILILIYTLRRGWSRECNFWIALSLFSIILSLGPELQFMGKQTILDLPELLLNVIPVYSSLHVPARFMVFTTLSMSVLLGFGISKTVTGLSMKEGNLVLAAFFLIILIDFLPYPMYLSDTRISPFFQDLREYEGDFAVLNLPSSGGFLVRYNFFQTIHEKDMVWGTIQWNVLPERQTLFFQGSPFFRRLSLRSDNNLIVQDVDGLMPEFFDHYGIEWIIIQKRYYTAFYESFLSQGRLPAMFNETVLKGRDDEIFSKTRALVENVFNTTPIYEDDDLVAYRLDVLPSKSFFTIPYEGWDYSRADSDSSNPTFPGRASLLTVSPREFEASVSFEFDSPCEEEGIGVTVNDDFWGIFRGGVEFNPKIKIHEGSNIIEFIEVAGCGGKEKDSFIREIRIEGI